MKYLLLIPYSVMLGVMIFITVAMMEDQDALYIFGWWVVFVAFLIVWGVIGRYMFEELVD